MDGNTSPTQTKQIHKEIRYSKVEKRKGENARRKNNSNSPRHPGLIDELPPGTQLENGMIVGEEEATLYISYFEKELFAKIQNIDPVELRETYSEDLHWFQRVGNFRKRQKCAAIQKMQAAFDLEVTPIEKCISYIMKTENETWGS